MYLIVVPLIFVVYLAWCGVFCCLDSISSTCNDAKKVLLIPSGFIEPVNIFGHNTQARLDGGLQLWKTGKYDLIIVSGATNYPEDIQTIPAGTLMSHWLIKNKVPKDVILIDDCARDSYENVDQVLLLLEAQDIKQFDITLVSTYLHDWRIGFIFAYKYNINIRAHIVRHKITLKELLGEILVLCYTMYDPHGIGPIAQNNRANRDF